MKKILIVIVSWFIFLNLLNVVSYKLLFDKTSYELPNKASIGARHVFVPWLNFDGRNYLKIAIDGYSRWEWPDVRVFFPLYPILVRLSSLNLAITPVVVGLAISAVCLMAAIAVFVELLKQDRISSLGRLRIIALMLVFPTSFYFISFYTESLFLLLVLSAFYFLNKKNFLMASLLTFLATATRITGLALLLPLAAEAYSHFKKSGKIAWPVMISPAGFILFAAYIQYYHGGASSIIASQKNWNKPIGLLGPYYAIKDGFTKFIFGSPVTHGDVFGRSMEVIEFLFAALLIFFLVSSYKKIKTSYWLYVLSSAFPIFFSGVLSSIHRYTIVMFPIFIWMVGSLDKKRLNMLYFVFTLLLAYLASLYLRGYWVA